MRVNKIDRNEKFVEIIKDNKEVIDFNFKELDELITFLYKIGYINYCHDIHFNHNLSEVRMVELINGKYTTKIL